MQLSLLKGCVLYSLLCGSNAFYGEDAEDLEERITRGQISMENERWDYISNTAKDLVLKLLETNTKERLSAKEALMHDW